MKKNRGNINLFKEIFFLNFPCFQKQYLKYFINYAIFLLLDHAHVIVTHSHTFMDELYLALVSLTNILVKVSGRKHMNC